MRLAELLVLPDRGADRVDEVHLAGAEQVVLGRGRPLHEVPGGVLLLGEVGHGQRPDPDIRRRRLGGRVGGERRVGDVARLLVVAAIHEVAEDVGVEDHAPRRRRRDRCRPGTRCRSTSSSGRDSWIIWTHCLWKAFDSAVFIAALSLPSVDGEVLLAEVRIGRQEARMDRRPGARAAHADAVGPAEHPW